MSGAVFADAGQKDVRGGDAVMDTDFQLTRRADLKQPDGVVHGGDQKRVGLNGIAQPDRGRKDVPNDADPCQLLSSARSKNIGGGTP